MKVMELAAAQKDGWRKIPIALNDQRSKRVIAFVYINYWALACNPRLNRFITWLTMWR